MQSLENESFFIVLMNKTAKQENNQEMIAAIIRGVTSGRALEGALVST